MRLTDLTWATSAKPNGWAEKFIISESDVLSFSPPHTNHHQQYKPISKNSTRSIILSFSGVYRLVTNPQEVPSFSDAASSRALRTHTTNHTPPNFRAFLDFKQKLESRSSVKLPQSWLTKDSRRSQRVCNSRIRDAGFPELPIFQKTHTPPLARRRRKLEKRIGRSALTSIRRSNRI